MFKKRRFIIGGIIIILAISYLGYAGFESSATYYYTVSELIAMKDSVNGENVRVNGQVKADSVLQETGERTLRFTIMDTEKKDELPIVYRGIIPDTFQVDMEVVIEGNLDTAGVFHADSIITKCPSKYVPAEQY